MPVHTAEQPMQSLEDARAKAAFRLPRAQRRSTVLARLNLARMTGYHELLLLSPVDPQGRHRLKFPFRALFKRHAGLTFLAARLISPDLGP
jgi:hypothetical protein